MAVEDRDIVTIHLPQPGPVVVAVLQAVAEHVPGAVVRESGGYRTEMVIAHPIIEVDPADEMLSEAADAVVAP